MKYDIAKNDEGPLRRTKVKKDEKHSPLSKPNSHETSLATGNAIVVPNDQESLPKHHPGADERLGNIETHMAVRYGKPCLIDDPLFLILRQFHLPHVPYGHDSSSSRIIL